MASPGLPVNIDATYGGRQNNGVIRLILGALDGTE